MEKILEVKGLSKHYPKFDLSDLTFSVPSGCIMGFIGRNGAGKTTTLKSILNLVHIDGGEIKYFGLSLAEHEQQIKQRIGFAGGAVDYYKKKRISQIVEVTKSFYEKWDNAAYVKYMDMFGIDDEKTPSELSEGMKVKFNLALSLSHHAELLILDEPTSGLDPVSREELLEIFRYLRDGGVSILFSTHITSDLDKCADGITYIRDGHIVASRKMSDYVAECCEKGYGNNLEEIMIYFEKEALREKLAQ